MLLFGLSLLIGFEIFLVLDMLNSIQLKLGHVSILMCDSESYFNLFHLAFSDAALVREGQILF